MKEITVSSSFTIYQETSELPEDIQELLAVAVENRKNAYAPYSKFRVGAALLLDNGMTVGGSNQENAAYPSGLCAERVAIFHASAIYPDAKVLKIVISAAADSGTTAAPIPPCGACRQVIAEYEVRQDSPVEIYFAGDAGPIVKSDSLRNLLPFTFDKNFL